MAKATVKRTTSKGGGGFVGIAFLGVIALILLVLVSMASVIIVLFGLLPSFVAILIDRSPQRFAALSVFGMNFAGVFPFLLDLWMGSNSTSAAIDTLTDVFSLFIMYGGAAAGWVFYAVTPPIVTTGMTFIAQRRVASLQAHQKKLVEEWGDEVAQKDDEQMDEDMEQALKAPGSEPSAPGKSKSRKK